MKTLISTSLLLIASAAYAQPKSDKAAPPAQEKAAAAPKAPMPPPPIEKPAGPPKPPQEMADMIKGMNGTWKCTGSGEMGGEMKDIKASITHKSDLNGWYVRSDFTGTVAKMPPIKFTMYTTYDPATKKLWRVNLGATTGAHTVLTGTVADKKMSFEGDAHWASGDVKVRNSEEMVSPKEVKVIGEYSKDGGKTWNKDHEATCKK